MPPAPEILLLRINIPILKLQKSLRVNSSDLVWDLKRQVEEKTAADIKDVLNYGIFLHGKDGKRGKFLDERNTLASHQLGAAVKFPFS